jgi:hypothetical protein
MKTHGAKSTRFRGSPPGRQALDAVAQVEHLTIENALLRDRVGELELRARDLKALFATLRGDCIATYMGGYSSAHDIELFQHGMTTVCNFVDALLREGA